MDSTEFDRRVGVVEDALYELKNSGYAQAPDVTAIDNMLACTAELKVELYGMLLGWNNAVKQIVPPAPPTTWLDREDLIEELSDAIDDRMDMDVSYSMLAEACVDRLIKLNVLYPFNVSVVNGFRAVDLFACGLLAALFGVGMQAIFHLIPIGG